MRRQHDRARSRRASRRRSRQGPSACRRGDDPRQPAAARRRSGRQGKPVRVPYGGAAKRPRALRQPADRARRRGDAGGGDGRRRAPEAPLRGRAAAPRTRPRALRPRNRGGRLARGRRAWRRRGGTGGRAAQHRRDLRNAVAIPQRDGAARHRRLMGRRPPDARHPEPGAAHGPRSLRRLLRRPAGKRAHSHPVHRRRLRLEGDPRRGAYPLRACGPHDGPAGEAHADARPDVRAGRPSRRDAAAAADSAWRPTAG